MRKIGYFEHQASGCYWYRIKHPMDALARHNIPTRMIRLEEDVVLDEIQSIQVYGIYPFSFEKALSYLKEHGKKIVYDLDDALDLIDLTNPFYYSVKRDSGSQKEIFALADHVTVATNKMAEYARAKTGLPITVIPNSYNANEWTFKRPKREGIRIGFAGSPTHIDDLLLVLPAIKNLQRKYNIKFLLFGFGDTTYENWIKHFKFQSPPEGIRLLEEFENLMKDINFEFISHVPFDIYPQVLTNMSLDIGLCPLRDTPFNLGRSASKAMEYTLSGALSLASDIGPYQAEMSSVLVKDSDWETAIEIYINNPGERKLRWLTHLEWLRVNRNIDNQTNIDLLKSVYVV